MVLNCTDIGKIRFRCTSVSLLFLIAFWMAARAGPPFLTDDPEPLPYRHGEALIAPQILNEVGRLSIVLPGIEVNYGVAPEVMAHVIVPFLLTKQDSVQGQFGLGDIELGVKYRFFKETDAIPQAGTFPHVEIPTGDSSKAAGSGSWELFVPLWLQKSFGPWTTYGGGGFWIQLKSGSHDFWFFGWELQRDISWRLMLGAELFCNTGSFTDNRTETGFNAGGVFNFTKDHHLLFSAGRDFSGPNTFLMYLAYQLTFEL